MLSSGSRVTVSIMTRWVQFSERCEIRNASIGTNEELLFIKSISIKSKLLIKNKNSTTPAP